jgi:hypothetical protein
MGRARQTRLPLPISETICRDWQSFRTLGVEGATIQCWTQEHSAYALNNLAFAAVACHEHVDPERSPGGPGAARMGAEDNQSRKRRSPKRASPPAHFPEG